MERLYEKTIKDNEKRTENEISRTRIILEPDSNRDRGLVPNENMPKTIILTP